MSSADFSLFINPDESFIFGAITAWLKFTTDTAGRIETAAGPKCDKRDRFFLLFQVISKQKWY